MATNDILKMAVSFHGAHFLPGLRALTREQVQRLANEASDLSNQHPLQYRQEKQFIVPTWDSKQKLSGCQVIALMVFGVWILCGEDESLAAPLVDAWPIKEALLLCPKP